MEGHAGSVAYRTLGAASGITGAVLPTGSIHLSSTASRTTYDYLCQVQSAVEATIKIVQ